MLWSPLFAGITMDMVTRDASGQETDRSHIYAQSGKLRVDGTGAENVANVTMIFLGSEFLILDHDQKSYVVMDDATLDEFALRISEAMKQIEAQIESLPPEQRAIAEQARQARTSSPVVPPRVEAIATGKWNDRTCTQYLIHEGGEKTQLVCAASLDHINGSEEMMLSFAQMADYVQRMTESLPISTDESMNPGELMDYIEGFPVQRTAYQDGEVVEEDTLELLTEVDLDENLFRAPGDYIRMDPFQGP